MSLVQVRPGRPTFITLDGVRIYIAVHDAEAMRGYRELRGKIVASHPDRGGTARMFIAATEAMKRFVRSEETWYRQYGLTPPWEPKPRHDRAAWNALSPQRRRLLIEDAIRNCRWTRVACRQFGVSKTTFRRWCLQHGVQYRRGRVKPELPEGLLEETVRLVKESGNASEVARRLGLTPTGVMNRMRRAGVTGWRRRRRTVLRNELVSALRASASVAEAARRLGRNNSNLHRTLKKIGVDWREHTSKGGGEYVGKSE